MAPAATLRGSTARRPPISATRPPPPGRAGSFISGVCNPRTERALSCVHAGKPGRSSAADQYPSPRSGPGLLVGPGSAGCEVIRDFVNHLPVMTTPRWVRGRSFRWITGRRIWHCEQVSGTFPALCGWLGGCTAYVDRSHRSRGGGGEAGTLSTATPKPGHRCIGPPRRGPPRRRGETGTSRRVRVTAVRPHPAGPQLPPVLAREPGRDDGFVAFPGRDLTRPSLVHFGTNPPQGG